MRNSSSKDDGGGCYRYDFHHVDGGVTQEAQLHARGCPLAALRLKRPPERATSVDNLRSEEEKKEVVVTRKNRGGSAQQPRLDESVAP